jgi:hypothetical protein
VEIKEIRNAQYDVFTSGLLVSLVRTKTHRTIFCSNFSTALNKKINFTTKEQNN